MGIKDVDCEPIRFKDNNVCFNSVLKCAKTLFDSCVEERKKLVKNLNNADNIAQFMILCYIDPASKLKCIDYCIKEYKNLIKYIKQGKFKTRVNSQFKKEINTAISEFKMKINGLKSLEEKIQLLKNKIESSDTP